MHRFCPPSCAQRDGWCQTARVLKPCPDGNHRIRPVEVITRWERLEDNVHMCNLTSTQPRLPSKCESKQDIITSKIGRFLCRQVLTERPRPSTSEVLP